MKTKLRPLHIITAIFLIWFLGNTVWMVRITCKTQSQVNKLYQPQVKKGVLKKTPKVKVAFPYWLAWPFIRKAKVSFRLDYTKKYLEGCVTTLQERKY